MKKIIVSVLAFCLVAANLSGASKKKEGKISKIKPAQTVTLTVVLQPGVENIDDIIAAEGFELSLLEKFNVKLNVVKTEPANPTTDPAASDAPAAPDSPAATAPAGDLIIYAANSPDYSAACSSGWLLDWETDDLVKKWAPYLLTNGKLNIQKNKFLDSPDRTIHGYSPVAAGAARYLSPYTWEISSEVYEKAETPKVMNLNNYVEVLLQGLGKAPKPAAKADGGDEAAESTDEAASETPAEPAPPVEPETSAEEAERPSREDTNYDYDFNYVKDMIAAYYAADFFNYGFYFPETYKFVDLLANESPYLAVVHFLNKLAQKDIYVKDYLNIYLSAQAPEEAAKMTTVIPESAKLLVYEQNKYGGQNIWAVSAESSYKELCIAVINWLGLSEQKETPEFEENYVIVPQTLYQPAELTEEVQDKWTALIKIFEEETPKIINAKDDETCAKLIGELTSKVRQEGYDQCIAFTNKLVEKRVAAEKLTKGKIK